MRQRIAFALTLAWAIALVVRPLPAHAASADSPPDVAAAVDGLPLAGSRDTLHIARYRGKVVLLNFFTSWCPPCRREARLLANLEKRYAGRGFAIVGIDEGEDAAHVRAFRTEFGSTYPIALDRTGSAESAFDSNALPLQIFLNRDGNIVLFGPGPLDAATAASTIEKLLRARE